MHVSLSRASGLRGHPADTVVLAFLSCACQVIVGPRGPGVGCSFVLEPSEGVVRDLRIYVSPNARGNGHGSAIVDFVKAYFFPHYQCGPHFCLPIGGIRSPKVRQLTVLPSKQAKRFYRRHRFEDCASIGQNKWAFTSTPCFRTRLSRAKATSQPHVHVPP